MLKVDQHPYKRLKAILLVAFFLAEIWQSYDFEMRCTETTSVNADTVDVRPTCHSRSFLQEHAVTQHCSPVVSLSFLASNADPLVFQETDSCLRGFAQHRNRCCFLVAHDHAFDTRDSSDETSRKAIGLRQDANLTMCGPSDEIREIDAPGLALLEDPPSKPRA